MWTFSLDSFILSYRLTNTTSYHFSCLNFSFLMGLFSLFVYLILSLDKTYQAYAKTSSFYTIYFSFSAEVYIREANNDIPLLIKSTKLCR